MAKRGGSMEARLKAQEKEIDRLRQQVEELQEMASAEKKEPSPFALKAKLPTFNGADPQGWLNKAELYFRVNQTPDETRLAVAEFCMEGIVVNWFTIVKRHNPEMTWSDFREEVEARFIDGESEGRTEALLEELSELKQQRSPIAEYLEKFEAIAADIPDLTEDRCVKLFKEGLRDEIKEYTDSFEEEMKSFAGAVSVARRCENWLENRWKRWRR